MQNKVQSLSVGTAMENKKFSAVVLKLKLAGGDFILSRWDRNATSRLLQALGEYMLYLHTKKIDMNSDAVAEVIKQNVPSLSQAEIEYASPTISVANIKGRVEADQTLKLSIYFQQANDSVDILIAPVYVMPLNDHVGNILDSFDSLGTPIPPDGTIH